MALFTFLELESRIEWAGDFFFQYKQWPEKLIPIRFLRAKIKKGRVFTVRLNAFCGAGIHSYQSI